MATSPQQIFKLHELFGDEGLYALVWREHVASLVKAGTTTFDLAVKLTSAGIIDNSAKIGVTYWDKGPVVKGVQIIAKGQTVVFKNVPVKTGGELVIAMDDEYSVEVSAEPVGYKPPPMPTPETPGEVGERIGKGLGKGIGMVAVIVVIALIIKSKVMKAVVP
jgi:hypothetical protein